MKIKTLTPEQINKWIAKHVPTEFESLDLGKMCAEFQEAVAKANTTRTHVVKSIICEGCGEVHDAGSVTLLSIQYYVPPSGCTDGAYWTHSKYAIKCEGCGHMLEIPHTALWVPPPKLEMVYPENGRSFTYRNCKIVYKILYQ